MRHAGSLPVLVASLMLAGLPMALADEKPVYECFGFPLTPLQLQVLAADQVREQSPVTSLTYEGMPASPHQLSVLRTAVREGH